MLFPPVTSSGEDEEQRGIHRKHILPLQRSPLTPSISFSSETLVVRILALPLPIEPAYRASTETFCLPSACSNTLLIPHFSSFTYSK